jgi:transcriptional regulator with XRE-family HTH domain
MSSNVLKYFGERVREERLKRNLSQEALAETAGVHRTYIGMIERAEKNITLTNIEKVANGLGLTIEQLFKSPKS